MASGSSGYKKINARRAKQTPAAKRKPLRQVRAEAKALEAATGAPF